MSNVEQIADATEKMHRGRRIEAAAKAIFWCMCSVMHDHEKNWRECGQKNLYRECAAAALIAASVSKTVQ